MPESAVHFHREKTVLPGPIHYPFWFGGSAACMAACVTHPLDLIKVRLQTQPQTAARKNMLQMFVHVSREQGVLGLYKGLSAALLRQATYSTTRFGVYEGVKDALTTPGKDPSMWTLIAVSSISGFLGGIAGNPADVLNVRMQHDAALPPAERRNYRNAIDGLVKMARHEGPASLMRGVSANSSRAVLMTAGQLASYDGFKRWLLHGGFGFKDDTVTHFTASFLAGFVATTICSPVDVIKTRVMSAKGKSGGMLSVVMSITREEGLRWCFRGWVPSFIRVGPHTIATFLFLEQHKKYYRKLIGRPEPEDDA